MQSTMSNNIKNNKPNPNSRWKQGYYQPTNLDKYIAKQPGEPIIYRSSLEYKFMRLCDNSASIVKWSNETLFVPYEFDGKLHKYWLDFVVQTDKGQIWLVEVKPYSQTQTPSKFASDDEKRTYMVNRAKWQAAINYAAKFSNMHFKIITERFFQNI